MSWHLLKDQWINQGEKPNSPLCYLWTNILFLKTTFKANAQRHTFVNDQLDEMQTIIHKLVKHKDKFKKHLIHVAMADSSSSSSTPATTCTTESPNAYNSRNSHASSVTKSCSAVKSSQFSTRKSLKKPSSANSNLRRNNEHNN